jgi:small subunit ribosomal protein S8e
LAVVYNASNNELVRTNTLVKNCIVQIDSAPFKQWYENHYGHKIGVKKGAQKKAAAGEETGQYFFVAGFFFYSVFLLILFRFLFLAEKKLSNHVARKHSDRQKTRTLDPALDEQFVSGRLLACISSRPGQSGRADGYVLEGKELEFYTKMLKRRKQ